VLELAGPAERTLTDAANAFGKVLGKPVHAFRVPDEGVVPALRQAGMSQNLSELYLEMNQALGSGLFVFDGHKQVRGTTTLETFVSQALS